MMRASVSGGQDRVDERLRFGGELLPVQVRDDFAQDEIRGDIPSPLPTEEVVLPLGRGVVLVVVDRQSDPSPSIHQDHRRSP